MPLPRGPPAAGAAAGAAAGFGFTSVTGTVRNLPDGRVELLAEGERADVVAFLAAVRARFARQITNESADWQAVTGRFASFDVSG